MARVANANSTTFNAVDQVARTQSISLSFYISSNDSADYEEDIASVWNYGGSPGLGDNYTFGGQKNGNPPGTLWGGRAITVDADRTFYWRCYGAWFGDGGVPTNETKFSPAPGVQKLAWAVDPTVGDPSLSGETSSSVAVDFSWTPATNETAVDAIVQYKASSSGTWLDWTSISDENRTGYTSRSSPANFSTTTVTGLTAETSYDFRIKVDRNGTQNTTKLYYSNAVSTSTIADTPSVTTNAATSVGSTTATLNATVDHNTVDGNLSWRYLLTSAYQAPPNDIDGTEVSFASNPITGDGSGSKAVTGLTESSDYTFWAIYDPTGAGDTVFGSALTFSTTAAPSTVAKDEEHTVYIEDYGKYGVAKTVLFPLYAIRDTSADLFVTDANPFGSAAFWVSKNGATPVAVSAPNATQISSGKGLYSIDLSTSEMSTDTVDVIITDGGTSFRDVHIHVTINRDLGQVDIDSSQNSNVSALILTGQGTGHGVEAVKGATGSDIEGVAKEMVAFEGTAQASASSTTIQLAAAIGTTANDDLNGCMILLHSGAGAGQARIITDYVHATQTATVHKAWNDYSANPPDATTEYLIFGADPLWALKQEDTVQGVSPGAELSALPYYSDYYAEMLQYIFQRVAYQRTETAAVHKMYETDGAVGPPPTGTVFAQYSVDDDGDLEVKQSTEDV